MIVLKPEEYDISYFDGYLVKKPKRGGYFDYSLQEHEQAETINFLASLLACFFSNQPVLEIGCAKGLIVDILRKSGINAFGIDISKYAINNAPDSVKKFVQVGNIRKLSKYKNKEWFLVYTIRTLECLKPKEIPAVVRQLNRISQMQIHFFTEPHKNDDGCYTYMTLKDWRKFNFDKGTKLISYQTKQILTK